MKKINAELEAMSDDELSMVAGGKTSETVDDSRFLNSLNGSCDRYGGGNVFFMTKDGTIQRAWETVRIKAEINGDIAGATLSNKYFLDGKQITQEEARQHAMKVTGHYMTEADWKW